MMNLLQDLRFALRQLRKSPGFTLTAVITLALGIGANTAIFTLVQGIMLRSLPVADPSHLYRIGDTDNCCIEGGYVGDDGDFDIFSLDLFEHLKKSAPEFEQLAAVQAGRNRWSVRRGSALSKPLQGEFVSGNFFATLGLGAYAGRVFMDSDDMPGAPPAIYRRFDHLYSNQALHRHRCRSSRVLRRSCHGQPARLLAANPDGALCPWTRQLHPA